MSEGRGRSPAAQAARAELAAHPVDAIVIGGSAGGLKGLMAILPALPAGFAVPVLVVMHVPPDRLNPLPSLFESRCALPVAEAQDKQRIEPGAVLFAPAGCHLLVERGGTAALSVDEPVHHSRPAIDPLFETAAWTWGRRLLGVVLSGASEDGAAGLAAIAAAGGLAWPRRPSRRRSRSCPAPRSAPRPARARYPCLTWPKPLGYSRPRATDV